MQWWIEDGHEVVVPPPPRVPSATIVAAPPGRHLPPPPPGSPAPPGPAPGVHVRLNGFAVASMVLGIFGLFGITALLAVIFGHLALGQIKSGKGWQRGTGMALAGVIMGWSFLAIIVLALVFEPTANLSISPSLVEYRLDAWSPDARATLSSLLTSNDVPAEWHESSLLVPVEQRATVHRLIAFLDPPPITVDDGAPAGWYFDPLGEQPWRWWDGCQWLADDAPGVVFERPWMPERDDHAHAIRGGVLALLGFVVGIALSLAFSLLAVAFGADEDSLVVITAGQAGLWSGLTAACVIAVRRSGSGSLRDLGLVGLRRQDFGVGAVAAVVTRVACAFVALVFILIFPIDSFRNTNSATTGVEPSVLAAVVIGLIVCVGAPFFEELFFRGLVQGVLTRRWGARIAIVTQAIGFALVHYRIGMSLELTLATWAQIAVAGLVLGSLRWRYERLGPSMIAHALFNAIAIAIVFATW